MMVTHDPEDSALASRAAIGDIDAFEALMRKHSRSVWTYALAKLGDRGEAEEATQDTFLKAYRSLGTWRREASFRTWLFAICRNQCTDRLRRGRAEVLSLDDFRDLPLPTDPVSAAVDRIGLATAVRTLGNEEREAFMLVNVMDMTAEEAARLCNVPATTLKSRLYRAHDKLIKQMTDGKNR